LFKEEKALSNIFFRNVILADPYCSLASRIKADQTRAISTTISSTSTTSRLPQLV
tara:strand:- start:385 stop:549 length:165 start_codon:yes stop_codon:yes gene_type:complete